MKNNEIIELVRDINDEAYEAIGLRLEDIYPLVEYMTDGSIDIIKFLGINIWDSESDPREWIDTVDDYEPLEGFIRGEMIKILDLLNVFRKILKKR